VNKLKAQISAKENHRFLTRKLTQEARGTMLLLHDGLTQKQGTLCCFYTMDWYRSKGHCAAFTQWTDSRSKGHCAAFTQWTDSRSKGHCAAFTQWTDSRSKGHYAAFTQWTDSEARDIMLLLHWIDLRSKGHYALDLWRQHPIPQWTVEINYGRNNQICTIMLLKYWPSLVKGTSY